MRGRTARNSSETCAELVGDLRGHFQKIPENSREFQKNPHCAQLMLRHFLPARNSSETCADTSREFQKVPETTHAPPFFTCAELVGDLRGHFQKIPENSRDNLCSAIYYLNDKLSPSLSFCCCID